MVTLRVPIGSTHVQIDDFGLEVERSCKGSLHLHPGSIRQVTPSEWEHIRKHYPDTASQVQVLDEGPAPKLESTSATSVERVVESAPPPAPEPVVQNTEVQVAKSTISAKRRFRRERMMKKE